MYIREEMNELLARSKCMDLLEYDLAIPAVSGGGGNFFPKTTAHFRASVPAISYRFSRMFTSTKRDICETFPSPA